MDARRLSLLFALLGLFGAFIAPPPQALAQTNRPPADAWVTNYVQFPQGISTNSVHLAGFEKLHAEAIAGSLRIGWQSAEPGTNTTVIAWASADEPGHWPARDWRPYSTSAHGNRWEASIPVDNVDVPLIYFVEAKSAGSSAVSLMRVCHPRRAGLEEPSRVFWPFLEGFEEGIEGWRLVGESADLPPLRLDPAAKNGRAALRVTVPPGKRSVTLATTRLRGWQILQQTASGMRVWLRTKQGTGKVRFTLLADAHTTNQVVSICPTEPAITEQWQRVDVAFSMFPRLPLANADLLTLEFIGQGPLEFLVDDLQLLGRWRMELE